MALAAAIVMSAGKAGLDSIEHFIDEFIEAGIPMLEPVAIDHSTEDASAFQDRIADHMRSDEGDWRDPRNIFRCSPDFIKMLDSSAVEVRDTVQRINQAANEAEQRGLADNSAYIAAATRTRLGDFCRETYEKWLDFKNNRVSITDAHLAVVIPYCPEGPTSGTVGMLLGAAIRDFFQNEGRSDEVVVWGIELCTEPNVPEGEEGGIDQTGNDFRGYVARQELCNGGVPLDNSRINDLTVPFDINIVVDGGKIRMRSENDKAAAFQAIDRGAAQIAAVMLTGAVGDAEETRRMLTSRNRWNAILIHTTSSRSWENSSRYRATRAALPWVSDQKMWDFQTEYADADNRISKRQSRILRTRWRDTAHERKEKFIKGVEYTHQFLEYETNDDTADLWEDMDNQARYLRKVPTGNSLKNRILNVIIPGRKNRHLVEAARTMDKACQKENDYYRNYTNRSELNNLRQAEGKRTTPFCINVNLPVKIQEENAVKQLQYDGIEPALADIIGSTGIENVKQMSRQIIEDTMQRRRPSRNGPQAAYSSAQFRRAIGVVCYDNATAKTRGQFQDTDMQPPADAVRYLLAPERQRTSGSYTTGAYTRPLYWELAETQHQEYQKVRMDLTYIFLAEADPADGFKDISSYTALESNYRRITSDPDEWRRYAKYYSGNPPPEIGGKPELTPRTKMETRLQ